MGSRDHGSTRAVGLDFYMYKLTRSQKDTLRLIASFYGCRVKFKGTNSGYWTGTEVILVGKCDTLSGTLSIFFHELTHFINWKLKRYPTYHNPKNFGKLAKKFKSKSLAITYALKAELFTDKEGKKLCKEWFPSIKYKSYYSDTKYCYRFLYHYYFGQYP